MNTMPAELLYTTLTAAFVALIWIPIIINRLRELGVWTAVRSPRPDGRASAEWAYRLDNAHRNAIENLVVFAPLALMIHQLGVATPLTAAAAAVFFYTRVAHAVIYALGIPVLRTLCFAAGFFAQMVLAGTLLGIL